jgi:two-component system, chemotaxis family, chemotaxis protein CheY
MARILVIDDQEPIRRVVRRALEMEKHEVLEASEGEMGMELLAREHADIVITDIFMPGQDGILTLRQIRKQFPDVKVIVMSGGDSTGLLDLRRDAELLGAVSSLQKPFNAREIVAAVRVVLGQGVDEKEKDRGL